MRDRKQWTPQAKMGVGRFTAVVYVPQTQTFAKQAQQNESYYSLAGIFFPQKSKDTILDVNLLKVKYQLGL